MAMNKKSKAEEVSRAILTMLKHCTTAQSYNKGDEPTLHHGYPPCFIPSFHPLPSTNCLLFRSFYVTFFFLSLEHAVDRKRTLRRHTILPKPLPPRFPSHSRALQINIAPSSSHSRCFLLPFYTTDIDVCCSEQTQHFRVASRINPEVFNFICCILNWG